MFRRHFPRGNDNLFLKAGSGGFIGILKNSSRSGTFGKRHFDSMKSQGLERSFSETPLIYALFYANGFGLRAVPDVAAQGVDFAVVRDEAMGMRPVPAFLFCRRILDILRSLDLLFGVWNHFLPLRITVKDATQAILTQSHHAQFHGLLAQQ
jgi:hypothetical protein